MVDERVDLLAGKQKQTIDEILGSGHSETKKLTILAYVIEQYKLSEEDKNKIRTYRLTQMIQEAKQKEIFFQKEITRLENQNNNRSVLNPVYLDSQNIRDNAYSSNSYLAPQIAYNTQCRDKYVTAQKRYQSHITSISNSSSSKDFQLTPEETKVIDAVFNQEPRATISFEFASIIMLAVAEAIAFVIILTALFHLSLPLSLGFGAVILVAIPLLAVVGAYIINSLHDVFPFLRQPFLAEDLKKEPETSERGDLYEYDPDNLCSESKALSEDSTSNDKIAVWVGSNKETSKLLQTLSLFTGSKKIERVMSLDKGENRGLNIVDMA
ncbi:MAG: hypothetical protein Q8R83_05190 [Legionellaceae bacterium]|nr:hypothetical protein [Legionellaceae bacterium]